MFDWLFGKSKKDKEIDAYCRRVEVDYNHYQDLVDKEKELHKTMKPGKILSRIDAEILLFYTPFNHFPSREAWITFKLSWFGNLDWEESTFNLVDGKEKGLKILKNHKRMFGL